jgi:hypothetical protein
MDAQEFKTTTSQSASLRTNPPNYGNWSQYVTRLVAATWSKHAKKPFNAFLVHPLCSLQCFVWQARLSINGFFQQQRCPPTNDYHALLEIGVELRAP